MLLPLGPHVCVCVPMCACVCAACVRASACVCTHARVHTHDSRLHGGQRLELSQGLGLPTCTQGPPDCQPPWPPSSVRLPILERFPVLQPCLLIHQDFAAFL